MKITEKTNFTLIVFAGILIIINLILSIVIYKSYKKINYNLNDLSWNIDSIESHLDSIDNSISTVVDDIDDIKSDVDDIEYYLR